MLHQAHAEAVAGLGTTSIGLALIKDADHLAAALERRYFFGDFTGDMEHKDVPRLIDEVFPDGVFPNGIDDATILVDADIGTLNDLIQGVPRGDVYVLGDRMIRDGKAVAP